MRARILMVAAALAAGGAHAAECPAPDEFVKTFYAEHPDFERENPKALRRVVSGAFRELLEKEWTCSEGHTKVCHLDYRPWTGTREGTMLAPPEFTVEWQAERQATVVYTLWVDGGPHAPAVQRTGRVFLVREKRGCWRVNDFSTPVNQALSLLYKRPLRTQ